MVVVCEAGSEIITLTVIMVDKKARLKDQRSAVAIVLSIAALVLLAASFFIRNEEAKNLTRLMAYGLILATILFRVIKGTFGYKPTREEIEEKIFGNTESTKEN
jgi:uncharacterized membrane protein YozB (DUF420 family)